MHEHHAVRFCTVSVLATKENSMLLYGKKNVAKTGIAATWEHPTGMNFQAYEKPSRALCRKHHILADIILIAMCFV